VAQKSFLPFIDGENVSISIRRHEKVEIEFHLVPRESSINPTLFAQLNVFVDVDGPTSSGRKVIVSET
jgi:hypothetical protein